MANQEFHTLRLTLECLSPLSIGSGQTETVRRKAKVRLKKAEGIESAADLFEDTEVSAIVQNRIGLPVIPGSSWQGVSRRLLDECYGPGTADAIFGMEQGIDHSQGSTSRIICGWGHVHNKDDQCVREDLSDIPEDDEVLKLLAGDGTFLRDHVAVSDRGSTDGHKKFQRHAVPKGCRFSIEMSARGGGDQNGDLVEDLIKVARMFRHPRFRLGGSSNRGYGRFKVVRASICSVPLHNSIEVRKVRTGRASEAFRTDLLNDARMLPPEDNATRIGIVLKFRDFLRFGGTQDDTVSDPSMAPTLLDETSGPRRVEDGSSVNHPAADKRKGLRGTLTLLREPRIAYSDQAGAPARVVLPERITGETGETEQLHFPVKGSSLKGPLVHRMVYHDNRLATGIEADGEGKVEPRVIDVESYLEMEEADKRAYENTVQGWAKRSDALVAMLGSGKGPEGSDGVPGPGQAARLLVDDSHVDAKWVFAIDHTSIDRVSGGVRDLTGALYREEVFFGAELNVSMVLMTPLGGSSSSPTNYGGAVAPFLKALRDLCSGRLPIGARSLGACKGTVTWSGSDKAAWEEKWDAEFGKKLRSEELKS